MSLLQDFYHWADKKMPTSARAALKSYGIQRVMHRWNPRNDPSYEWPIPGPLQGHRMRLRKPEDWQYLAADYELPVTSALQRLIQPGWSCVDVGAHIGYFTLLMAKLVGQAGRVVAFEVVPENARVLSENVRLNGYRDRVKVENCAVSDDIEQRLPLYKGPSSFEATIVSRGWEVMLEVPAVSLDRYFSSDARLDLVKMDIEGGEVKAIPGMARLLKEMKPLVLLEIHDVGWPSVDFLIDAGFTLRDLSLNPVAVEAVRGHIPHCIAVPPGKPLL